METWYPISGFSDPMSSLSHLVGLIIYFLLGIFMIRSCFTVRSPQGAFRYAFLFIAAVVLLLTMSFVYHMQTPGSTARAVMLRLDIVSIFTLIASTFTAIHGLLFVGWQKWGMIATLWTIAIVGIIFRTIFFESIPSVVGDGIFLLMGWLGAYSTWMLWKEFGSYAVGLVIAGGLCYTIGAIINAAGKLIIVDRVWGPHETFHLFVLAGIGCHWAFIWSIVDGSFFNKKRPESK